jgi:hypothetical protein
MKKVRLVDRFVLLFLPLLLLANAGTIVVSSSSQNMHYLPIVMNKPSRPVTSGVIISAAEIANWPTAGTGWKNIKSIADHIGTDPLLDIPDLTNQNNKHNMKVLAQAIIYARTGDVSYQNRALEGIMSAKGTERVGADNSILSLGRQLGGYVFAADLIQMQTYFPQDYTIFRDWLWNIRTQNLGGHAVFTNLNQTHEQYASNWSTFAGASRIAADAYLLNDPVFASQAKADLDRAANVFAAWLGDRSKYPGGGYFKETSGYDPSWSCDPANWTAVNPPCSKTAPTGEMINLDGAIVSDLSRGGAFAATPGSDGVSYSWEGLQGAFVQAEILYRLYLINPKLYPYPSYDWSNHALERAMNFMRRINNGWTFSSVVRHIPWMESYRYNLVLPTVAAGDGRIFGYTDWLFFGK